MKYTYNNFSYAITLSAERKAWTSRISSLETREEIRFIESFGFSNIDSSGRKFASAFLGWCFSRAKTVHPCNNRGSYRVCLRNARLQRYETASVARIQAQTIISLINPVGLAQQTDNSVQC